MKKPTAKQKKTVMDAIGKLKERMDLQGYEISVLFHDLDDRETEKAADCTPDWRYRRATINIYAPFWKENRYDVLKHEFTHILLSPLMLLLSGARKGALVTEDETDSTHEHVTTWISSLIR